jgi:hypothetical protein
MRISKYNPDVLRRLYVDEGRSLQEIADIYGVAKTVINVYLTKYSIPRNRPDLARRHNLKLHNQLFDKSNPYAMYLLGLVLTDGHISEYGVRIKLSKNDAEALNTIYKYFYQTEEDKPESRVASNTESLSMGSKELMAFLAEFGLLPGAKTFSCTCPIVFDSRDCLMMFLRGVLDGDGCVYMGKSKSFMFNVCTASTDLAEGLAYLLETTFGVKVFVVQKTTSAGNPLYYVQLNGAVALKVIQEIYAGFEDFGFKRKREIITKFAAYKATAPKPGNKNWDARGRFTFNPENRRSG